MFNVHKDSLSLDLIPDFKSTLQNALYAVTDLKQRLQITSHPDHLPLIYFFLIENDKLVERWKGKGYIKSLSMFLHMLTS